MNRVAFLFPGQGSQYTGMGQGLFDAFPESREVFESADRLLEFPLSRLCFEGNDADLALTENTQPAILTVSVAALRALEQRGVRPAAVGGHSLGEYSALVAAGTLSFGDAVRTVRRRGRFMQEAVGVGRGAMAAILGLARIEVERLCREQADSSGEVVGAANLNGPGQVVIAGHAGAVERTAEACRAAGAKRAVPLPVSAPFHCSLMQPVARRLAEVLECLSFSDPSVPVYNNVDAVAVQNAAATRAALIRQVDAPVLWHDLVESMLAAGFETFVEVGPGKVLSGLMRRINRKARVLTVEDAAGVEKAAQELEAVA